MQPSEEDLMRWRDIAAKRDAVLPLQFEFVSRKFIAIVCGNCQAPFTRPLIAGQNDPIYVCPGCSIRNYIPIDWNVIRR